MKTLLVGDLHLKAQIILPLIEKKVRDLGCQQVILLGDYMDAYDQTKNVELYLNELKYLLSWKSLMQMQDIKVITLLGNHDAPYLAYEPKIYSLQDNASIIKVHDMLLKLGLQVSFKLDDYLVSHAVYTETYKLEKWHLSVLGSGDSKKIAWLEEHSGVGRGGRYSFGSPIWADFEQELCLAPNKKYSRQIVGHTPQNQVNFFEKGQYSVVGIDTFTVVPKKRKPYFEQTGSGEVLLYENGGLTPVLLNWKNDQVIEAISHNFYRSRLIDILREIVFDFEKWSITIGDDEIFLTNKEFEVFVYLFEREGQRVSDVEIFRDVLAEYEATVSVDVVLSRLSEKVEVVKILPDNQYILKLEDYSN